MKIIDPFLDERLNRYDKWLSRKQISFSSKVIPVCESLEGKQWILPEAQVTIILKTARSITLKDCECRTHYKRCENQTEVCLLFNEVGDKSVSMGHGRHIDLDEALTVLRRADESGLVHLSLYRPDHQVFALCSCCSCCCHDLQIIREYDRRELMVHSEYIAETDMEQCIHCGECPDRCIFNARKINSSGELEYDPGACCGCGLCVSICPGQATQMNLK